MAEALARGARLSQGRQARRGLGLVPGRARDGPGRCRGQQPPRPGTGACRAADRGHPVPEARGRARARPARIPVQSGPGATRSRAYGSALAELGAVLAREPGNVLAWERAGDVARQQATTTARRKRGAAPASWLRRHRTGAQARRSALAAGRFDAALAALDPWSERAAEDERIHVLRCQASCRLARLELRCAGLQHRGPAAVRLPRLPGATLREPSSSSGRHRAAVEAFGKAMATGDAQRGGPCRLRRAVPARIGLPGRGSGIDAGRDDGAEQARKRWPTWHCSRCIAAASPNPRRIAGERWRSIRSTWPRIRS